VNWELKLSELGREPGKLKLFLSSHCKLWDSTKPTSTFICILD